MVIHKRINLSGWIKISRVQTGMVTALALWVGYASVQQLSIGVFSALGVIGLLVHIWGFMLNEIKDKDYDQRYSSTGHPLTSDEISTRHANIVAWLSGIVSVGFSYAVFGLNFGLILMLFSFIAGTMYNTYSKRHWWSNVYLSAWVLLLTFSGAAFAGSISIYTWLIGIALSIQIFVQVIEGDLKDIKGPEKTMAERAGVHCYGEVIKYPLWFRNGINILKMAELTLLGYVVYDNMQFSLLTDLVALTAFTIVASVFMATTTYYLTKKLDRDKIKKRSSIHELSSIIMFGITIYWLDNSSSILIALAPVVWYLLINKLMYSSSTNPDI